MRTTVTLDADVEHLLKDEAHRTRRSFKQVLNEAVRVALTSPGPRKRRTFAVKARPLGLKAAYHGMNLNHLAAQLEDEETLARGKRSRAR